MLPGEAAMAATRLSLSGALLDMLLTAVLGFSPGGADDKALLPPLTSTTYLSNCFFVRSKSCL